jgi:hypothetical protein
LYGVHTVKKGILSSSTGSGVKRISFDDNVQMIEEPSYPPNAPITPTNEEQPERYRFRPRQPYVCNPNKLFENNSTEQVKQTTSTGAMLPPKEFLKDLQRVMKKMAGSRKMSREHSTKYKKWTIIINCKVESSPSIGI